MEFLKALHAALSLALHGDLAGAEALLKTYFEGTDDSGTVHTDDGGGGGNSPPPR